MASKAKTTKKAEKKAVSAEDKAAKRKARMEALKNRPAGQRTNSKQIDIVDLGNGQVIKTYGYPVVAKRKHIGVLTTSVVMDGDKVLSVSQNFIPGDLTVKVKKEHGVITAAKAKKGEDAAEEEEDSED